MSAPQHQTRSGVRDRQTARWLSRTKTMINAAYVLWELKHGQRGVATSHPYRNYKIKKAAAK